jgi:hypothetical protein
MLEIFTVVNDALCDDDDYDDDDDWCFSATFVHMVGLMYFVTT